MNDGDAVLGTAEGLALDHILQPLGLLAAVVVEIDQTGIYGVLVVLILATVEHHNGRRAEVIDAVVAALAGVVDVVAILAGQMAACLVVATHNGKGLMAGKALDRDVDEACKGLPLTREVAHNIAIVEDHIHLLHRHQIEQCGALLSIVVNVVSHHKRNLVGRRIEGAKRVPRRGDLLAKDNLIGLEAEHTLRCEAVLILGGGAKAVNADGVKGVVGLEKAILRGAV